MVTPTAARTRRETEKLAGAITREKKQEGGSLDIVRAKFRKRKVGCGQTTPTGGNRDTQTPKRRTLPWKGNKKHGKKQGAAKRQMPI